MRTLFAAIGLVLALAPTVGFADFATVSSQGGGGWCNAGDCVPAPPLPMGPIGSPWGWLPFGLPQSGPFG